MDYHFPFLFFVISYSDFILFYFPKHIIVIISLRHAQIKIMIYNGPITDPRHRYYMQPPEFNYHQISEGKERYVKFRAQPVNLSRTNHAGPNLSNSHIYTKNGLLRRNEVGWDGVKLT